MLTGFLRSGLINFDLHCLFWSLYRRTLYYDRFRIGRFLRKEYIRKHKLLGNDVVYVQKWPWNFGDGYPWWEYQIDLK